MPGFERSLILACLAGSAKLVFWVDLVRRGLDADEVQFPGLGQIGKRGACEDLLRAYLRTGFRGGCGGAQRPHRAAFSWGLAALDPSHPISVRKVLG